MNELKELLETNIEQFKIRFENMYSNSITSWWSQYKYPSFGSILHWLYTYGNFDMAEMSIVGKESILYHGKIAAKYKMDNELQMPIFEFNPEYEWMQINQEIFLEGLKNENTREVISKYKHIYGKR